MGQAFDFANNLYEWAEQNGYLAGIDLAPIAERTSVEAIVPEVQAADRRQVEDLLEKKGITAILYDDQNSRVTVLTAGALGPRNSKALPERHAEVEIDWIGSAQIQQNPQPLPAQPPHTKRCYIHNGKVACGSSITAAPVFAAGTMGCLIRDQDGDLCGLTNNHVTGGCNHMQTGMPILAPSPMDATPVGPEPRTLGRHKSLIMLESSNPIVYATQAHDVATFTMLDESIVTSMQGPGHYDTPQRLGNLEAGKRVKKCGRTTEVTRGTVIGAFIKPVPVPYRSDHFNALVYLGGMFGVQGDNGEAFSLGGDSGSLVVSEDGSEALGLIVAGMGESTSVIMPILPLFTDNNWTLVSGHNG